MLMKKSQPRYFLFSRNGIPNCFSQDLPQVLRLSAQFLRLPAFLCSSPFGSVPPVAHSPTLISLFQDIFVYKLAGHPKTSKSKTYNSDYVNFIKSPEME